VDLDLPLLLSRPGLAEFLLHLPALGHVAGTQHDAQGAVGGVERPSGALDPPPAVVLMAPPGEDGRERSGFDQLAMPLPGPRAILGVEASPEPSADERAARAAQNLLEARVGVSDGPVGAGFGDQVEGVLSEGPETLLAVAQCLLHLLMREAAVFP
jgi:hypothetical protein